MSASRSQHERNATYLETIHGFCYRDVSFVTRDVMGLKLAICPVLELDSEESEALLVQVHEEVQRQLEERKHGQLQRRQHRE
jgi:hypothetical protein